MSTNIIVVRDFITLCDLQDMGYAADCNWCILHVESAGTRGSQRYTLAFPSDACRTTGAAFKVAARVLNLASYFEVARAGRHANLAPKGGNSAAFALWAFCQYSEDYNRARNALRFSLV